METTITRKSRNLGYGWSMGRNAPTGADARGGLAAVQRERDRHLRLKGCCDTTARFFVGGQVITAFDNCGEWDLLDNLTLGVFMCLLLEQDQVRVRLGE